MEVRIGVDTDKNYRIFNYSKVPTLDEVKKELAQLKKIGMIEVEIKVELQEQPKEPFLVCKYHMKEYLFPKNITKTVVDERNSSKIVYTGNSIEEIWKLMGSNGK